MYYMSKRQQPKNIKRYVHRSILFDPIPQQKNECQYVTDKKLDV